MKTRSWLWWAAAAALALATPAPKPTLSGDFLAMSDAAGRGGADFGGERRADYVCSSGECQDALKAFALLAKRLLSDPRMLGLQRRRRRSTDADAGETLKETGRRRQQQRSDFYSSFVAGEKAGRADGRYYDEAYNGHRFTDGVVYDLEIGPSTSASSYRVRQSASADYDELTSASSYQRPYGRPVAKDSYGGSGGSYNNYNNNNNNYNGGGGGGYNNYNGGGGGGYNSYNDAYGKDSYGGGGNDYGGNDYGGGGYGGGGGCYSGGYGFGPGQNRLLPIVAVAALGLLAFFLFLRTTTTAGGGRELRVDDDDEDAERFDPSDVMLDGPTWLSLIHELWEQDGALEEASCAQHTLCRMNRMAMAAPGQAGWAVSASSLPLSYLLHHRHGRGFTSYLDASLVGRTGANCTELFSSCPRLQ